MTMMFCTCEECRERRNPAKVIDRMINSLTGARPALDIALALDVARHVEEMATAFARVRSDHEIRHNEHDLWRAQHCTPGGRASESPYNARGCLWEPERSRGFYPPTEEGDLRGGTPPTVAASLRSARRLKEAFDAIPDPSGR